MAEDEDLEILGSVGSTRLFSAYEETDEGADDEVEEGSHRPIVPGLSERDRGFRPPRAPWVPAKDDRPAQRREALVERCRVRRPPRPMAGRRFLLPGDWSTSRWLDANGMPQPDGQEFFDRAPTAGWIEL